MRDIRRPRHVSSCPQNSHSGRLRPSAYSAASDGRGGTSIRRRGSPRAASGGAQLGAQRPGRCSRRGAPWNPERGNELLDRREVAARRAQAQPSQRLGPVVGRCDSDPHFCLGTGASTARTLFAWGSDAFTGEGGLEPTASGTKIPRASRLHHSPTGRESRRSRYFVATVSRYSVGDVQGAVGGGVELLEGGDDVRGERRPERPAARGPIVVAMSAKSRLAPAGPNVAH